MKINIYVIIVILSLIATLVFDYYSKLKEVRKRDTYVEKLLILLKENNYSEFYAFVDSEELESILPKFNRMYLKLNASIMEHDDQKVDENIKILEKINMRDNQKEEFYLKVFSYYCDKTDKNGALKYKERILNTSKKKETKLFVERLYDIRILKGWKYLEDILKETKTIQQNQRIGNYLLISYMYKNKGIADKAKEYDELVRKYSQI